MDYSKKIEEVKEMIAELKKCKHVLLQVEEAVCSMEAQISLLDESLPTDEEIAAMVPSVEKEQVSRLVDLNDMAFELIDEILGPPVEEGTPVQPAGKPSGNGPILS